MNGEAVYRTALATPGLLNTNEEQIGLLLQEGARGRRGRGNRSRDPGAREPGAGVAGAEGVETSIIFSVGSLCGVLFR